jgi:putative spermidine/putrescine transport system substrate-binding protein
MRRSEAKTGAGTRAGALALLGAFCLWASPAAGAETLTIVTWGGAYEESQRIAYFEPFTRATGIEIEIVRYDGGLDEVRRHLDARDGAPTWDVVDMVLPDAERACTAGLIAPIEPSILADAPDGTPAEEDFMADAIGRCWVGQLVYSTVFAYDERAFPGLKPRSVADLFDVERFPGVRALQRAPIAVLEWALLSYDVPRAQIYDLLSTERGLDLAFRRLDRLRGHLTWWRDGSAPPRLLEQGRAAIASGYNGRFFAAIAERDAPIAIVWDGQLLDQATWTVLDGADDAEAARRFIAFATRADRLAAQASLISYGPTRRSARERIGRYADSNIPMRPHLPTAPRHMERAIVQDHAWYARTERLRRRRFEAWLESLPSTGPQAE